MSKTSAATHPTLSEQLRDWIAQGGRRIGEIAIEPLAGEDRFRLRHHADVFAGAGAEQPAGSEAYAEILTEPKQAREIVRYNAAGEYRPLKTAPDLRRGWVMELDGIEALREALDYYYPAMAGTYFRRREGKISPVQLRATLDRQTGMYRFARTISDGDAQALIGATCNVRSACLKHILWKIDETTPVTSLPTEELTDPPEEEAAISLPLLCVEACNLVVAGARIAAKEAAESDAGKSPTP